MKSIKTLGLAALAALMATTLAGTSPAMAGSTQLCANDTGSCSPVTSVHEVSQGKAIFSSNIPAIKCNVLFSSTSVGGLGEPQVIEGKFSYSGCNNFCVVEEENGPAIVEVLRIGAELATVTYEHLVQVTCPFTINCAYTDGGLTGHARGALAAANGKGEVFISSQELNPEGGTLCPSEMFFGMSTDALTATYIKT